LPPRDFIVFVAVVLLVLQFGARYVLTYRLTDEDVQAVLFGIAAVSLRKYQSIEEVQVMSALEALFTPAWRVQNRVVGRAVAIYRRRGFFPVLYTPDDPEGFARELRRRVYQQTGRLPLGS
jgi:hypothetical protein